MQVHVREATPDDAARIAEVAEAAWWAGPASALSAEAVRTALADLYGESFLAEVAAEAADSDGFRFLVAERTVDDAGNGPDGDAGDDSGDDDEEREVVGFASAAVEWADEAELFTLYVHPDHWGEGVGTALLGAIREWAADHGVDRLVCSVLAENAVGVGFFESRGFERVRTVEGEVGGRTVDEVELEAPVDG